ncbi:MAG: PEP-CTERM sorting domain-containing protein, partial [Myxococcales bacterium]|nr:PEP-CTERM sorting domain-containing protein [Myxococcales bacterium]
YGVEVVPEPSGEILLLAGVLGLVGLRRLRERGGASALCASLFTSRR